MEQARRPAMADHVHRIAPMGARVLINGTWYKPPELGIPLACRQANYALAITKRSYFIL